MQQPVLRVAYTRGVTPAKWARVWAQRRPEIPLELVQTDAAGQLDELRGGGVQLAFVRLPVDSEGLHLIALYEERPVVVVAKEHVLAAGESVTLGEIDRYAGGPVRAFDESVDTEWDDAAALVAAGVGALVVPHSIARLHARKDLVARDITDGEPTRVALVWAAEAAGRSDAAEGAGASNGMRGGELTEAIEEFVGIVRGRTVNSSRGASAQPTVEPGAPNRSGGPGKSGKQTASGASGRRSATSRQQPRGSGARRAKHPKRKRS